MRAFKSTMGVLAALALVFVVLPLATCVACGYANGLANH